MPPKMIRDFKITAGLLLKKALVGMIVGGVLLTVNKETALCEAFHGIFHIKETQPASIEDALDGVLLTMEGAPDVSVGVDISSVTNMLVFGNERTADQVGTVKKVELPTPNIEENDCQNEVPFYDPIIELNGNVSPDIIALCSEELAKLPSSLKTNFSDSGWHLILTETEIEDLFPEYTGGNVGRVAGITVYPVQSIYVENRRKAVTGSVLHEFGHYASGLLMIADANTNVISGRWEDLRVASTPAYDELGIGTYGLTNADEFFAECFMVYINTPEKLRNTLPDVYYEMENVFRML